MVGRGKMAPDVYVRGNHNPGLRGEDRAAADDTELQQTTRGGTADDTDLQLTARGCTDDDTDLQQTTRSTQTHTTPHNAPPRPRTTPPRPSQVNTIGGYTEAAWLNKLNPGGGALQRGVGLYSH